MFKQILGTIALTTALTATATAGSLNLQSNGDTYDYIHIDSEAGKDLDQSMSSIYRMGGTWNTINRNLTEAVSDNWIGGGKWSRIGYLLGHYTVSESWMYNSQALFVHEHAHLVPDRIVGGGAAYGKDHKANGWERLVEWGLNNQGGGEGIWKGYKTTGAYDLTDPKLDPYELFMDTLYGGINAEQTMAAQLGEQSRINNFVHVADAATYLQAKLAMTNYDKVSDGDRKMIVESFKTGKRDHRGYSLRGIPNPKAADATKAKYKMNIKDGDLVDHEAAALLLSASTYNYFSAIGDYVSGGKMRTTRNFHKIGSTDILWPDFEAYGSGRGLSMRMSSAYQLSDSTQIPFTYEKVTKGLTSVDEYGLGITQKVTDKLTYDIRMFGGSGFSARANMTYDVMDNMQVFGEVQRLNYESMDSRRYLFATKKAKANRVVIGLSYKF